MSRNYIRYCKLVISGANLTLDVSNMRIRFQVRHAEMPTVPQTAYITIYNLTRATQQKILQAVKGTGKAKVDLTAGYKEQNGLIFTGEIIQAVTGQDNPVDKTITLVCKNEDTAHNYGVVNTTLPKGHTYNDQVDACLKALEKFGVQRGFIDKLDERKMPRPRVLTGMAKDLLKTIGYATKSTFTIVNGKAQVVKNENFHPGDAIVVNSSTGMVGRPQQSIDGIRVRMLLNPRCVPSVKLKIDEASIDKQLFNPAYGAEVNNTMITDIAADGIYKILYVDHVGDSRGAPWYTECNCMSASSDKVPFGLINRGIVPDNNSSGSSTAGGGSNPPGGSGSGAP